MPAKNRVFVWNLPYESAENDVAVAALKYGSVAHVYFPEVAIGKKAGAFNNGYGFVEFLTEEAATKFIDGSKNNEVTLGDGEQTRVIKAEHAKSNKKRKSTGSKNTPDAKIAAPTVNLDNAPIDWTGLVAQVLAATTSKQEPLADGAAKEVKQDAPPTESTGMDVQGSSGKDANDEEESDNNQLLKRLPEELWSLLFTYIDLPTLIRLKRVCRQFRHVVDVTIVNMRTLDLRTPPCVLFERADNLPIFGRYANVDDVLINRIFSKSNNWRGLRSLKLNSDRVRIRPISIKCLAESLTSLEDLSLCCHRNVNTHLRHLVMKNRNLRRLTFVSRSGSLSIKTIRCLLRSCRGLTHLTFESKNDLAFGDVVVDAENAKVTALSEELFRKKKPEHLRFLNCKLPLTQARQFESLMCSTFPNLIVAHLSTIPSANLTALRQLVLPTLPVGIGASIWDSLPSLESLIVMPVPNSSQPTRPDGADLTFLSSPKCRLAEIALISCNLRGNDLVYLHRLRCIDLRDNCSLTDDDIMTFVNSSTNIIRLGLRGLCQITGVLLRCLATACPRLKVLNIADCPKIDNEAIQGIVSARAASKSNFSSLDIIAPGCHNIEADQSFQNMLKTGGVSLLCTWADLAKLPIVPHLERAALENSSTVDWPMSARVCIAHRDNLAQILEFDHFIDIDDDDFITDDDDDDDVEEHDWDEEFEDEEDFG